MPHFIHFSTSSYDLCSIDFSLYSLTDWKNTGVEAVTTSPGLPYEFMGCKCEMPSVRHRSSGSDRNATIAFHFSAVAFVRFVQSISSGSPERSICSGPARSRAVCLQRFYRDSVTLETADSTETRWSWQIQHHSFSLSLEMHSVECGPLCIYLYIFFVTGHLHIWMLGSVF